MGSVGVKEREAEDLTSARALHAREGIAAAREPRAAQQTATRGQARSEVAAELTRGAPPVAPDAQAGQRLGMAKTPTNGAPSPTASSATLPRPPMADPLDRWLAVAATPEAQWPEIKPGQGILVERHDGRSFAYKREAFTITAFDGKWVELASRVDGAPVRVDLATLRARIGWQYGHDTSGWHKDGGNDVSWSLRTEANLSAPEPPAIATESMRAVMRGNAQRFDAALRAALNDPSRRDRWERVQAFQGRYRELSQQRHELEAGLAAHLKARPLRVSSLVGRIIPADEPGLLRDLSESLQRDPVEAAFRSQMSAIDDQLVDVGAAGAHVAGGGSLSDFAGTSSDPLVLAMAREEGGRAVSAATLLGSYLDNAEKALARGSTSGALIAMAASLQPFLALETEGHGSMHMLPAEDGAARRPSLTKTINQLIVTGALGHRGLVHSSKDVASLASTLSNSQLSLLMRRHRDFTSGNATIADVSAPPPLETAVQRRERRMDAVARLDGEARRLEAIENSAVHREFLANGGQQLLTRADEVTRQTLGTARADELLQFGRGVADVFDSLNTWVMAGTMLATRGIGAASFARGMPQLGELLLAYRAGRLGHVAMQTAGTRYAMGAVGTSATFTSLNNLALSAIGEQRYVDWSPAAFTTNLLALTAFDYTRARSFVRNFETAPAVHGSIGLHLHNGRLMAQQAAEQLAGMSAVGLGAAYVRSGNLDAAEQVLTANVQFLIAMAAVGKLGGNKTVVPEEVARIERLLRDYRQLPPSAAAQRKSVMEEALEALRGVTDDAMPARSAQLAMDMIASSRVAKVAPNGANVPLPFSTKARALIDPLMRPEPFEAPKGAVTKPGRDYVAVFPSHPLDGDSVMSALATVRGLRSMGVEAYMSMSQPLPRNLRAHGPRANEVLENAPAIFAERPPALAIGLDGQMLFGRHAEAMPDTTPMLRIDHHTAGLKPTTFAGPKSATWVDTQSQSAGQLVGDFLDNLAHSYARNFNVPRSQVMQGGLARDIVDPLMIATYTDVWGGAARPLVNANDATLGYLRYLSQRTDAASAFAKLGGQLPVEVRNAINPTSFETFSGGFGMPRTAAELQYPFNKALGMLERIEGTRRGYDHHRDLKGRVLDHLDGFAQSNDVVIAMVPETNLAGMPGTRFFLRSYAHADGAELTAAVRNAAVRAYPDKASLIDAGGKQHIGGGWMPLTEAQLREVMRNAIRATLEAS